MTCWLCMTPKRGYRRPCGFFLMFYFSFGPLTLGEASCQVAGMLKLARGKAHVAGYWGLLLKAMWVHHLESGWSHLSQAFRWLQPAPTSWLQPHDRPWAKATWLSHSGPIPPLDPVSTLPRSHNTLTTYRNVFISIKIKRKKFVTKVCRLNNILLNSQCVKEKNQKYIETNENGNIIYRNLWYAAKAALKGKFIEIHDYLKNHDISNKQPTFTP